jgi:hypothetical protein
MLKLWVLVLGCLKQLGGALLASLVVMTGLGLADAKEPNANNPPVHQFAQLKKKKCPLRYQNNTNQTGSNKHSSYILIYPCIGGICFVP